MRFCLLALCVGLALPSRFAVLSKSTFWVLLITAMLLAVLLTRVLPMPVSRGQRAGPGLRRAALWVLCGLLGMTWAVALGLRQQAAQLPLELEGVDIWVEGVVSGLVQTYDRSTRVEFTVQRNCFRLLPTPCENQPAVLVGHRIQLNDYSALGLATGEYWRLRVRLTRPYGLSNPGTRDTQARLRQRGIVARGYVRETPFNLRLAEAGSSVQRWRAAIASRLDALGGLSQRGVLKALVIGDYSGFGNAQWEIFNVTGTSHLMVISGMHIGFVALLVYGAVNLLCRASVTLLSVVAAQRVAALAALLAAFAYSLLAGFSLPAQRSMIMLTVVMAGRLMGRRLLPSWSLLLAATLVLMRDPLAVTQPGFWLSFMAVASLMLGFVGHRPLSQSRRLQQPSSQAVDVDVSADTRSRVQAGSQKTRAHGQTQTHWQWRPSSQWRTYWQSQWRSQWIVTCGLLLPLVLWTGQVSLVSPLTNLLAIPLVSLGVVPAALVGTLLLPVADAPGRWLLGGANFLVEMMITVLDWVVSGAWLGTGAGFAGQSVVWQPAPPGPWSSVFMALASLVLLLPRGLVSRWYALLLLMPAIWPHSPPRPAEGELWAHFLDVGQGLAVVLQTRRHALLFDTGPSQGTDMDVGQSVIAPFLRHQRVDRLDLVIVSHWHDDHSGGLRGVLRNVPVSAVIAGRAPDRRRPDFPDGWPGLCRAGWQWVWDDVRFTVLHPDGARYGRENDYSCVLRVEAGEHSLLLTGDIEAGAERQLVARHGTALRSQVLQAAHHGSQTSSTALFLDAVLPQLVVIPAAYHNRFNHPATQVTDRLQQRAITVLQTGRSGAISVQLGGRAALVSPGISPDASPGTLTSTSTSTSPGTATGAFADTPAALGDGTVLRQQRLDGQRHWHAIPP